MTLEEEQELLMTVRTLHEESREHLAIAREYQREVGEPLKKLVMAIHLLTKVLMWLIGTLFTILGLREVWNGLVGKPFKL